MGTASERTHWRITPACAGKTISAFRTLFPLEDHPRVCGENEVGGMIALMTLGSPPRVRGKRPTVINCGLLARITPACAGKTPMSKNFQEISEDHPRVCGENYGDT